ncbi:hypothetical protein N7517_011027 [Penicillium concentricum]|uniref:Uncharacterized protein n=1 Tax=Penicillium concentricum TaxID=293559 RepID=A0A9W9RAA7_9EURO|nr:uncharacterized protein N7517_011027 [Penicillium concentricum]KAJ5356418.1 hypothetical protein N7517_011027 [Penicillium concentricum]
MSGHMVPTPHSGPLPVPSSSSFARSASVSTQGFDPSVIHTFDIPTTEESAEVLEFIGLVSEVSEVSRLVYERYCNRPDPEMNPDDLMAYVSGHLSAVEIPQYDNMSPREALRDIGLNQQIRDAITDPEFSQIFESESLFYWAKDTAEINYAALLSRQKLLKSHANQLLAHKKKSATTRSD